MWVQVLWGLHVYVSREHGPRRGSTAQLAPSCIIALRPLTTCVPVVLDRTEAPPPSPPPEEEEEMEVEEVDADDNQGGDNDGDISLEEEEGVSEDLMRCVGSMPPVTLALCRPALSVP